MICICPDIAYSVGVLSQHVACPRKTHMQAVKCIFCYLHGTSHYKLKFQSNDSTSLLLKAFVNSDWVGNWVDRKSISGFIIMLDQGAVSWGSKKQTLVSLSTVEAEFVAASIAVREILWYRLLFHSLDMILTDPVHLYNDNRRALELIKSAR